MAQLLRKTNLAEIFSESRSGTIAHKNKKRIKAVTHCRIYIRCAIKGATSFSSQENQKTRTAWPWLLHLALAARYDGQLGG